MQRTAARWTCRRWRNTRSVGDLLDELEWPSLGARRERSSLTFFYGIHFHTVSLDKDGYLAQAPGLRGAGCLVARSALDVLPVAQGLVTIYILYYIVLLIYKQDLGID